MGGKSRENGEENFHFYGRNPINRKASVRTYEYFQVACGKNSTAYIPRSYCFMVSPHETVKKISPCHDISRGAIILTPETSYLAPRSIGIGYSAARFGPASSTKRLFRNSVSPNETPP